MRGRCSRRGTWRWLEGYSLWHDAKALCTKWNREVGWDLRQCPWSWRETPLWRWAYRRWDHGRSLGKKGEVGGGNESWASEDSVEDKTKASIGVEIDSFEIIGFGTMPIGDETLSEHCRQKKIRRWLAEYSLWHDGKALRTEWISALQWGWDFGRWDRRRAFRTKEDPEMTLKLSMFALRSRRACGKCKTAEAMRILAIGRWDRVLHNVKSGCCR